MDRSSRRKSCWAEREARLPSSRGRPHQCRGLPGENADPGPPGARRDRYAPAAGEGFGREREGCRSRSVRSRRTGDAGTAIWLGGRARASGCRGVVSSSLHVHYEHAAPPLYASHPGPRRRTVEVGLHGSLGLEELRSRNGDPCSPDPRRSARPTRKPTSFR